MNVIIANERQNELATLDIDIIKSMTGEFSSDEIIDTFKNFYFNKMIIDLTAIKDFMNISSLEKITSALDPNKIIFLLPNIREVSTSLYLSKLISIGIYNFTNNANGVKYLVNHANTKEEAQSLIQTSVNEEVESVSSYRNLSGKNMVIGVKNITDHAGATTLIYMLKKELEKYYGETIYVVEVSRHDFEYFNVKNTIATNREGLSSTINKIEGATIILVDLNDVKECPECNEIIYLVEPSSIMLNKLMRTNRDIFNTLADRRIVLNKSLLNSKAVAEFEYEAKTKVFFNMPPLDDRKKSEDVVNLISKLNLLDDNKGSGKLFGIF